MERQHLQPYWVENQMTKVASLQFQAVLNYVMGNCKKFQLPDDFLTYINAD